MLPRLQILVDIDWKTAFADHPGVTVSEEQGRIVLNNVDAESIATLFALEDFPHYFYHFEIDGDGIPGRKYNKEELQKLINQKMPQQRIVISRGARLF